jgi:hypothetical protein
MQQLLLSNTSETAENTNIADSHSSNLSELNHANTHSNNMNQIDNNSLNVIEEENLSGSDAETDNNRIKLNLSTYSPKQARNKMFCNIQSEKIEMNEAIQKIENFIEIYNKRSQNFDEELSNLHSLVSQKLSMLNLNVINNFSKNSS